MGKDLSIYIYLNVFKSTSFSMILMRFKTKGKGCSVFKMVLIFPRSFVPVIVVSEEKMFN